MIKVDNELIRFDHFNDGACFLKYDAPTSDWHTITWLYDNDEELAQLMYLTRHIRTHMDKTANLNLLMPYVVNGRQDRVKMENDVFTLKYFADFINALKFDNVMVYDPHSVVSEALFNKLTIIRPHREISEVLDMYPDATIFFPDDGAMKRYREYTFGRPFGYGVKTRNWETKEIESLKVVCSDNILYGKDVVIIDDIAGTGGSIKTAAEQLKERGVRNIYVWVSHCENTILNPVFNGQSVLDIPNLITKLYTTDSIFTSEHPKIEILRRF